MVATQKPFVLLAAGLLAQGWLSNRWQKIVWLLCLSIAMALTVNFPAAAQAGSGSLQDSRGDGVSGLVVNQTVSASGQQFYRDFTEFWRDKADSESYILYIVEYPSRRSGNRIAVMYGLKNMFSSILPVKLNRVRELSEQAVEVIYANIVTLAMLAPREPDFSADEW